MVSKAMVTSRGESLTIFIKQMISGVSKTVSFGLLLLAVSACSMQSVSRVDSSKSISTINLAKYCKQLVGDLMGRDPNFMVTGQVTADIVSISYVRADDAKEFKYQCKEDEGNIIWRGVDIFGPGEGPGRWRNEDARPVSTFM